MIKKPTVHRQQTTAKNRTLMTLIKNRLRLRLRLRQRGGKKEGFIIYCKKFNGVLNGCVGIFWGGMKINEKYM
jgi:hypothetical protein